MSVIVPRSCPLARHHVDVGWPVVILDVRLTPAHVNVARVVGLTALRCNADGRLEFAEWNWATLPGARPRFEDDAWEVGSFINAPVKVGFRNFLGQLWALHRAFEESGKALVAHYGGVFDLACDDRLLSARFGGPRVPTPGVLGVALMLELIEREYDCGRTFRYELLEITPPIFSGRCVPPSRTVASVSA